MVCYQWALTTTSAAEVHAIVAVIPVLVLVQTWVFGEKRPDALSVLGTVVAGAGVAALAFMHA
jgi:drug/metabolite transporter (DMT)-like permease